MKKLILPVAMIFLAACSSNTNKKSNEADSSTPETKEVEASKEQDSKSDANNVHQIVGEWRADPEDAGAEIRLTAREDGTYYQVTAGQPQNGTWEAIDDNQVRIENKDLKNGQTWKIVNASKEEMTVHFSTSQGFSKKGILFKALK